MHDPHTASIFMVADMTGSVSLHQRLNEQEAERVIDRGLKRMTRSIEGQGGKVQQVVGDELLARFTQAEAACHAAIDMQQRVADLPPVSGHKLSLRVALATAADAAQGESQHITQALRLAALGAAGEILCDARLGEMLRDNDGLNLMPLAGRQISCDASPGSAGVSPFQLLWSNTGGNAQLSEASEPPPAFDQASRLCLCYLGQTYLVSDGEDLSTPNLLRRLGEALGRPARLWPCPPALLLPAARLLGRGAQMERLLGSLRVDDRKIRRELGWAPPYSVADGLKATVE